MTTERKPNKTSWGPDDRVWREHDRPLSVSEAAKLIGITGQRLAFFIRRGDVRANTLNGKDYVLNRQDVLEFDRNRRHGPGHPSRAELAERERKREINLARIERLRKRMETVASEIAAGKK